MALNSILGHSLATITGWSTRFAIPVLLAFMGLTVLAGWYTATHLAIDTDTTAMIDEDVPFRQSYNRYVAAFPDLRGAILAVVEAETPELARKRAGELAVALADEVTAIESVQYPAGLPYFTEHGLLFLSVEQLDRLADQLAEAQPMVAALAAAPDITGIARLYNDLVKAVEQDMAPPESLDMLSPLSTALSDTIQSEMAGDPGYLPWSSVFQMENGIGVTGPPYREVLTIYPVLDRQQLLPAARAIQTIRETAQRLDFDNDTIIDQASIGLTGGPVLAQEEMETVIIGAGRAGIISFVLVSLILGFGLRSITMIAAILTTLVSGLVLTAGAAALTVGTLNLISVAFAVLFVGLAVDFGIHFALRYREALALISDKRRALAHTAGQYGVGIPLLLCTLCTLVGFLAFMPTSYLGLAELGIISALGMVVAGLCSFTLLPALLVILPKPRQPQSSSHDLLRGSFMERHARPISLLGLLLFIASLVASVAIEFDVNPLNLRDPNSASVNVFKQLTEQPLTTPYRAQLLADNAGDERRLRQAFAQSPEIGSVISLNDFIPREQDEKLDRLFDLGFIIGPTLSALPPEWQVPAADDSADALALLLQALERAPTLSASLLQLKTSIEQYREQYGDDPAALARLNKLVGVFLHQFLNQLRTGINSTGASIDDLPPALVRDWQTADGRLRLDVLPASPITSNADMARFAEAVLRIAPEATGTPIIITGASDAVANAFIEATGITIVGILILLLLIQRKPRDVMLTLLPLILAATTTIAVAVLIEQPFNFANVIALPLLFALGVCSSIHMVWRQRQVQHGGPESLETAMSVEQTATPKAITLSALTTVASFGSLAISPHPGTASMGLLLMIAIGATLLTTLVFLPAFMAIFRRRKRNIGQVAP